MAYLNGKEYSPELAHKALVNIKKNGCTNVICPKCKKHPVFRMDFSSITCGERMYVDCPCGYIKTAEISF